MNRNSYAIARIVAFPLTFSIRKPIFQGRDIIERQTSVSETIRKPPIAEAQTALGKQKIRSVEHPLRKFYEKLLPRAKISLKNPPIG